MFLKLKSEGVELPESFVSELKQKSLKPGKVNSIVYVYNFAEDVFDIDKKEEIIDVKISGSFEIDDSEVSLDFQNLSAETKSFLLSL